MLATVGDVTHYGVREEGEIEEGQNGGTGDFMSCISGWAQVRGRKNWRCGRLWKDVVTCSLISAAEERAESNLKAFSLQEP